MSLRLLVEDSIDLLCRLTPDGTFLYASPACRGMLGFEPQQLVGRNTRDLTHPEDASLALSAPCAAERESADEWQGLTEYRLRRSDGSYIWVQSTQRVVYGEQGEPREIISVVRDITARKHAEATARHTERLASIGTLAAGIAHEINNPLGAILMAAHAARELNRTPGNEGPIDEMLGQILTDARRGARIVMNVLQFAQRNGSVRGPVELREIALRARQQAVRYADKRDVQIKVRGPDESPWVHVNAMEIEQVLVNLLHNSVDAGATRIDVTVRREQGSQRVTVAVTDNGKGMTADQIKHAFDPFFSSPSQVGGTGLGLSIAQGLVASHGGTITLASEAVRGTTVTFDLPLSSPVNQEPPRG